MHFENRESASFGRTADGDVPIKTTRTQQRRIQNVGAVGCGQNDDGISSLETVHFTKDLVERLLSFVVATAQAGTALSTDGIDFVDENNRR